MSHLVKTGCQPSYAGREGLSQAPLLGIPGAYLRTVCGVYRTSYVVFCWCSHITFICLFTYCMGAWHMPR